MGDSKPVLSVVVALVSDTTERANVDLLRPCLESLRRQVNPPSLEIIVPHYPGVEGLEGLRLEFPEVRFLPVTDLKRYTGRSGSREHHNELRSRGIAAARGEIVALLEDHGVASENWCAGMVAAHAAPVAAIGGAVENRVDRALNWAVYFCDFGAYQNPVPHGQAWAATDANVSYKRSALESIAAVWRDVFHEGAVNHALGLRGERLLLSPRLVVYQNRVGLGLRKAVKERFIWGWSYGAGRRLAGVSRLIWAAITPALPFLITARLGAMTFRKRRNRSAFISSLPLVFLMAAVWCFGEMVAYLSGARLEQFDAAIEPECPSLPENPRLSVVIVVISEKGEPGGDSELAHALKALSHQTAGPPHEIVVPYNPEQGGIPSLRQQFSAIRFLPVDLSSAPRTSERVDEMRAAGVLAATGDIVAVIEDHVRPDPDWSARIIEAHREHHAAIGGAIENGVDRVINWAAYFSDLGRYHNPLPDAPSAYASVVNVSYRRADLESVRSVWERRFNETSVHWALQAQGRKLRLCPRIIVRQHRGQLHFGELAREFFTWGRSYGSTRGALSGSVKRLIYAAMAPVIPGVLVLRNAADIFRKRRLIGAWIKSLPASVALTLAWSCGEFTGYVAGPVRGSWDETRAGHSQAAP